MLTKADLEAAEQQALNELRDEEFDRAVEQRKQEIRAKGNVPWYNRLFPFTIKIERI